MPGNAKLFGVESDLGLSGQQWNTCLSIFFVTYALGGVPSNIALKRFGPKIWLPVLLLSVSLILVFTSLQGTFGGWAAFRVLLGVFEAGVFPGCSFVLTSWYSPREVHSRMAIFYSGASAAGAFSGLLAYGIGQLDHTWGYRGWRFIYCIEGLSCFPFPKPGEKNERKENNKSRGFHCPSCYRRLLVRPRYAGQGGQMAFARRTTIPSSSSQVLSWRCREV